MNTLITVRLSRRQFKKVCYFIRVLCKKADPNCQIFQPFLWRKYPDTNRGVAVVFSTPVDIEAIIQEQTGLNVHFTYWNSPYLQRTLEISPSSYQPITCKVLATP